MTLKNALVKILFPVGLVAILVGCKGESTQVGQQVVPPPPDVGNVIKFMSCKATPRRALSDEEQCRIESLSARCLPADDCMVQCLSSPDGPRVLGGCEHVCFQALHIRPPDSPGLADCAKR